MFILRRPRVAIFAGIIKIVITFITKIFKNSKKIKTIKNYVPKCSLPKINRTKSSESSNILKANIKNLIEKLKILTSHKLKIKYLAKCLYIKPLTFFRVKIFKYFSFILILRLKKPPYFYFYFFVKT